MKPLFFEIKKLQKKYYLFQLYFIVFLSGIILYLFVLNQTEPDTSILEDSAITNPHFSVYGDSDGAFDIQDEQNLLQYSAVLNDINTWGTESNSPAGQLYMESMEKNQEAFDYLLQERIEPRYPLTIQITEYDFWSHESFHEPTLTESNIQWDRFTRHRSHYDKGWYVIWYALIENFHFIPLVIFVFLLSGTLTSEKTVKHDHLSFQTLEGKKRMTLFLEKFSLSIGLTVIGLMLVISGALSTSLFFNGLGSLNYPIFYHSFPSELLPIEISLIPLGQYLLQCFLMFIGLLFFIFSVTHTVGQFVKSEFLTSLIGIGLIVISQVLPPIPYSPFTYFNLHSIASGAVSLETNSSFYTYENGLATLFIWSVAIFSIGLILYTKRARVK